MPQIRTQTPAMAKLAGWFLASTLVLAACNLLQGYGISTASPTSNPNPTAPEERQTPSASKTPSEAETATETPPVSEPILTPGQAIPLSEGQALTLTHIDMINIDQGWGEMALDDASWALLHTNDGGLTWSGANPPGGYPAGSRAFALDDQVLWAAPAQFKPGESLEYGLIYQTEDGGQTWRQSQPIPLATGEAALVESFYPSALFFLDADNGWLVVSVGHYMNQDVLVIFNTQDGGITWQRQTDKFQAGMDGNGAALPCQVHGIAFTNLQKGWLAGDCTAVGVDERWKVLETNDGGKTWFPKDLPAPAGAPEAVLKPEAVCAPSGIQVRQPDTLLLDYYCTVYDQSGSTPTFAFTFASTNGGETWFGAEVTAASFADDRHGTSLGPQAQDGTRSLLVTANGGKTWTKTFPVTWPEAQLDFVDTVHGWAIARRWNSDQGRYDSAMVYTKDGGGVWELIKPTLR